MVKVGRTLSLKYGLASAPDYIRSVGGNALQIFVSAPQNKYVGVLPEAQVAQFNLRRLDTYAVVHGKYTINFCHHCDAERGIENRSMLVKELQQAERIGCNVIIHQGKNVNKLERSEALQNFVDNIVQTLDESNTHNKIVLENSARQGTEIGYLTEELAEIFHMIPSTHQGRISFCLDTCHTFASGAYDLRKRDQAIDMFEDFDRLIGLNYLEVVHFNDSQKGFDSHVDRHADLLCGCIGHKRQEGKSRGFRNIVTKCKQYDIPMILETPGTIMPMNDQINLLNSWAENDKEYETKYKQKRHHGGKVVADNEDTGACC
jgi:apurinic endonuclease APN1